MAWFKGLQGAAEGFLHELDSSVASYVTSSSHAGTEEVEDETAAAKAHDHSTTWSSVPYGAFDSRNAPDTSDHRTQAAVPSSASSNAPKAADKEAHLSDVNMYENNKSTLHTPALSHSHIGPLSPHGAAPAGHRAQASANGREGSKGHEDDLHQEQQYRRSDPSITSEAKSHPSEPFVQSSKPRGLFESEKSRQNQQSAHKNSLHRHENTQVPNNQPSQQREQASSQEPVSTQKGSDRHNLTLSHEHAIEQNKQGSRQQTSKHPGSKQPSKQQQHHTQGGEDKERKTQGITGDDEDENRETELEQQLRREAQNKLAEAQKLEQEASHFKSQLDDEEIRHARDVQQLWDDLEAKQGELERLQAERLRVKRAQEEQAEHVANEIHSSGQQLAKAQREKDKADAEVREAASRLEEVQAQLELERRRLRELQAESSAGTGHETSSAHAFHNQRNRNAQDEAHISELRTELERLRARKSELERSAKMRREEEEKEAADLQQRIDASGNELMQVQSTIERLLSERASLSMRVEQLEDTIASSTHAMNPAKGVDALEANVLSEAADESKTKLPSVVCGSSTAGKALAMLDQAAVTSIFTLKRLRITARVAVGLYFIMLHILVRALLKRS